MNILCVHRAHRFSPNSVERDAKVLQEIAAQFRQSNHQVICCEEAEVVEVVGNHSWDVIISMARSQAALQVLLHAEQNGVRVLNSASSLLEVDRVALTEKFQRAKVQMPMTQVVKHPRKASIPFPYWVKSGAAGAVAEADVVYIPSVEALEQCCFEDGQYVVAQHVIGDLIKFYGVAGTSFFYFYYPTATTDGFSKFGLECINGKPHYVQFKVEALQCIANKAAEASGYTIYGGDCVVAADGTIYLIDFNDFPSFSSCREAVAEAMLNLILGNG